MQRLVAEYETTTGISARITSGSTGKLVAQVLLGAPHDVFFSADQDRVTTLIKENIAAADSRFTYAIGRLVYWVPSYDIDKLPFERAFSESAPSTVALANAKLAPYGAAAERTLAKILKGKRTQPKLVTAENVGQVFAIVATGNAPAGFVALSSVKHNQDVEPQTYLVVPSSMHESINQDAIMLHRSKLKDQAIAFLDFVRGNQGRQIIARFGYDLP